jgi:hypothetical protein
MLDKRRLAWWKVRQGGRFRFRDIVSHDVEVVVAILKFIARVIPTDNNLRATDTLPSSSCSWNVDKVAMSSAASFFRLRQTFFPLFQRRRRPCHIPTERVQQVGSCTRKVRFLAQFREPECCDGDLYALTLLLSPSILPLSFPNSVYIAEEVPIRQCLKQINLIKFATLLERKQSSTSIISICHNLPGDCTISRMVLLSLCRKSMSRA